MGSPRRAGRSPRVISYERGRRRLADERRPAPPPGRGATRLLVALILVILICSVVLLILYLPALRVRAIRVEGNRSLSSERLVAASGLGLQGHMLSGLDGFMPGLLEKPRLHYPTAEAAVRRQLPWVAEVHIRPDLPSTIVIEVEERTALARLAVGESTVLLDGEGNVLELQAAPGTATLPLIEGVAVQRAVLGEPLVSPEIDRLRRSLELVAAIARQDRARDDGDALLERLNSIRSVSEQVSYALFRLSAREELAVRFGATPGLDAAINWLSYAVRAGKLDDLGRGLLDLATERYVFIKEGEGH